MHSRFSVRSILSYVLVVLISLGFVGVFLAEKLRTNTLEEVRVSLRSQAALAQMQISSSVAAARGEPSLYPLVQELGRACGARITVIDPAGRVLADSEVLPKDVFSLDNHASRPEVREALAGRTGSDIRFSTTLGTDMLYLAVPLSLREARGSVRLALPLHSVQRMLDATTSAILLALAFGIVLAFVSGSILSRAVLNPIRKIISAARRFSQGDFSRRIYHDSRDELGELAAALNKMAQDIEDKIRQVQAQHQHLSAIFDSMIEAVVVVDASGAVVSLNRTAEKLFGAVSDAACGKYALEVIRSNSIHEIIQRVLREGGTLTQELSVEWPIQKVFQISVSAVPGQGCVAVFHDVTEMRRLETMRKDFVANVSHELKTPLTSIKGFVETLLEGALEDKAHNREFLRIIEDHAERLNRLVEDLLTLSSLESAYVTLERAVFPVRGVAEKVVSGFTAMSKKKRIEVRNHIPPEMVVSADRERLEEVFTNLIDNALKFTPEGGSVSLQAEAGAGSCKVSVCDTGMGIPAKDIPRIFERFYRVDKARSRELGGTGLGLSIVKHIITLHGGTAGVESVEGSGSCFWFTLPR